MNSQNNCFPVNRRAARWIGFSLALLLLLAAIESCNLTINMDEENDSLKQTQMAVSVQQTLAAEQGEQDLNATITAQQATIDAQVTGGVPVILEPTVDTAATQIVPPTQGPPPPGNTPPPPPPADFETMMKSASILLYEDIVNDPTVSRYAKETLDYMGLRYKDDGSAKGWLKNDLINGAPNGKPWDLVILAIESRGGVTGEYFDYLGDVLDKGTSVILEAWHLDEVSKGEISSILSKCGVEVYEYFGKTRTTNDLLLWTLEGAGGHPILTTPNAGLTFTKGVPKWPFWDLGDLAALTGRGDAQLLLGTDAQSNVMNGALTVCMRGQLTLQGFSSHSYTMDVMRLLWENYIYNALRVRLLGSY